MTTGDPSAGTGEATSSSVRVVSLVALVAVVVASALGVWARVAAGQGGDAEELVLAFGIAPGPLPPALPAAIDGALVVGARELPSVPPGAGGCFPAGEGATVTAVPEAVLVLEELDGGDRLRTCILQPGGAAMGTETGGPMSGLLGSSCCSPEGYGFSEALVAAPEGTSWALQDRGGWWVAYPVSGPRAHVMWEHGQGGVPAITPVLFLDDAGEVIDEAAGA